MVPVFNHQHSGEKVVYRFYAQIGQHYGNFIRIHLWESPGSEQFLSQVQAFPKPILICLSSVYRYNPNTSLLAGLHLTSKLAALGRFIGTWYVSTILLIAVGLALGSTVFFYGYPGEPKIGVIDIPFTVINDRSAFEIVRLREKKPVVIVMEDLVASGGFMMTMATNYSMAKPSSFVGGVGVILSPLPPRLPFQPSDREGVTGPFKLEGGSRRRYVTMSDQLQQAFATIVVTERGDKLRITKNEILKGNLYSGVEAMQVGLIDGLGSHTDAIDKVASLAGIANFGLVDVNTEVSRIFNEKLDRINGPLQFESGLADGFGAAELLTLLNGQGGGLDEGAALLKDLLAGGSEALLTLPPPGGIGADPREALPDFPLRIAGPKAYYLYVGSSE